jgi:GDP-4-dehydro-6-deoxy-D-mannose reductase
VRDVVNAYVQAIMRFDSLPNGKAFNIATGNPIPIGEILKIMLSLSSKKIEIMQDPLRVRQNEGLIVSGNSDAARKALDWAPRHLLIDTLASVLDCYRTA